MPAGQAPTHFISIALSTVLSALRVSTRIPVLQQLVIRIVANAQFWGSLNFS